MVSDEHFYESGNYGRMSQFLTLECLIQLMTKHVFALIKDDACVNCSSYKPKTRLG